MPVDGCCALPTPPPPPLPLPVHPRNPPLLRRLRRCQAQGPLDWTTTSSKVSKTFRGLGKRRQQQARQRGVRHPSQHAPSEEETAEDRVTASIAAGLSNMPEENQMLYSALCILPPGLPVSCRLLEQVWETGKRTTVSGNSNGSLPAAVVVVVMPVGCGGGGRCGVESVFGLIRGGGLLCIRRWHHGRK